MKVLFYTRPDFRQNPAGDTVQMFATAQELTKLGVTVAISNDPNLLLTDFDLVHIFNITRIKESYLYFLNAQKQGKKIILSPIYWDPQAFLQREGSRPNDLAVWKHMQPMRARLLRECDLLLPNGEREIESLRKSFAATAPYQVIPNGFPDSFVHANPALIREKIPSLPAEFILCVGRISPRKNQLWLAKSCSELDLPLVLVGPINDKAYYEQVKSYPSVIHLGVLQGELLASIYAAAKAHALPSWFETPGLSSLEAGACGTVVISTNQGSTQEYFQDMALYVHPQHDPSLLHALEQVDHASPLSLMKHIRTHYPWSKIGKMTLAAYESLCNYRNF